jgi:glucose-6-phosphate dehydrogenase assembly protein OpcA
MSVEAGRLLKELDSAWVAVGKQESGGVLRACSMTLVVLAGAKDDPQELGALLAELMHEHPSRTVVLRLGPEFDGHVAVQCWMPFGTRQQICCEQIEIVCTPETMKVAAALILGLTVPDLPVNLWLRGAEWLEQAQCGALLRLADKVIVDGAKLDGVRKLASSEYVLADLAWTRITRWRQAVARVLEARPVERIDSIEVRHAGADLPMTARYLAAWLATALGVQPVVRADEGPLPPPGIGRVRLVHMTGPGFDLRVERPGTVEVSIEFDGHRTPALFPVMSEDRLLREELSVFGRDPVFDRTWKSMG